MHGALEQAIFERRLQVLKAVGARRRRIGRIQERVGRAERDREILGDPLGKFAGNIALADRRNIAGLEGIDGGNGKLVVDAGIVDRERCRKEAVTHDLVGAGAQGKRAQSQVPADPRAKVGWTWKSPICRNVKARRQGRRYSHRQRRRARLRVGTRACGQQIDRFVAPDDARGHAIGNRNGFYLGVSSEAPAWAAQQTEQAPSWARPFGSPCVGRPAPAAMADRRRAQGIAGSDRRRKRRANRCKDLHHKRDQDDRQELLKASTHRVQPDRHPIPAWNRPSRPTTPPRRSPPSPAAELSASCGFSDGWACPKVPCLPLPYCNTSFYTRANGLAISNRFGKCSKFEQSLPKMVTSCTIWSRSAPSVRPRGRLVVQVSGGTLTRIKQRRPANQDQIR